MSDKKIKVCVIGAGAAGLCAARHLAANSQEFEFTVFEKSSDIGGTWIYTDNIGVDDNGLPIHSSMYKNLRFGLFNFFKFQIYLFLFAWIIFNIFCIFEKPLKLRYFSFNQNKHTKRDNELSRFSSNERRKQELRYARDCFELFEGLCQEF